jgi:LysR family carnitine catabolism transcriptional activator
VRQRRPKRERGVGHPAAHHDLGTRTQRIRNGFGADISIGANELVLFKALPQLRMQQLTSGGRADFALCAAGAEMAGLTAELLCTDAFYAVMHGDHPLARKKSLVAADLLNQPFIHLSHTSSVRQLLDAALHPARINGVMEVEHLASVASLVSKNIAISVIPYLALFQFSVPNLVVRPLRQPKIVRTIHIVRQSDRQLPAAAEALLALLKKRRSTIRSELSRE